MSMHKKPLTLLEEEGLRAHGLPIGTPSQLSDVFRHGIAWAASQNQPEVQRLREVLDEYERQTKALPCQHEIPERGCSTYNWRMSVIRDLRAMLAASTGQEVES